MSQQFNLSFDKRKNSSRLYLYICLCFRLHRVTPRHRRAAARHRPRQQRRLPVVVAKLRQKVDLVVVAATAETARVPSADNSLCRLFVVVACENTKQIVKRKLWLDCASEIKSSDYFDVIVSAR